MRGMKKYEIIGRYVHLVDERNTNLANSNLLGVAKEKVFIPSVANVVGTDLSKYKVIRKGRFACNLMHVSRDEVLPVALFTVEEPAIISPAYPMFEVNDTKELLPEYLNMYLMRKEFDREVVFYAMNGVRGGLEWDDFKNMQLPIPDIEEQRRIVAEYQAIEKRIENNNRLIHKLEDTAKAIYIKECVQGKYEDDLPEGWKKYSLKEFAPVVTGKKDANIATIDGKYMFFTCSKEDYKTDCYSFDGAALLLAGNGDFNVKYYKGKFEAYQRTYVLIPNRYDIIGLLYNAIQYNMSNLSQGSQGSVISFLTKGMVEDILFYAPKNLSDFADIMGHFNNIINHIFNIKKEIVLLQNIERQLISKL